MHVFVWIFPGTIWVLLIPGADHLIENEHVFTIFKVCETSFTERAARKCVCLLHVATIPPLTIGIINNLIYLLRPVWDISTYLNIMSPVSCLIWAQRLFRRDVSDADGCAGSSPRANISGFNQLFVLKTRRSGLTLSFVSRGDYDIISDRVSQILPSQNKNIYCAKMYKQTPTPNETPGLIREKLAEFESSLDKVDAWKKRGYLMAKENCPSGCDDTFKLVFLRCEVFKVDCAVGRFVKYWNTRIEVFGKEKAFLPMTIGGVMKDDAECIQLGYLRVANQVDPDGRAILLFDFNKEAGEVSSESLLRVVWYQVHVALIRESCQKRGIVVYVQCLDRMTDWRPSLSKKITQAARGVLPVRFAGMHFMQRTLSKVCGKWCHLLVVCTIHSDRSFISIKTPYVFISHNSSFPHNGRCQASSRKETTPSFLRSLWLIGWYSSEPFQVWSWH